MPETVVHIRCMDEAINGPGEVYSVPDLDTVQIDFGLAGTGVTQLKTGDQQKIPDKHRKLFAESRPAMFGAFKRLAKYFDAILEATSHGGCGWGNGQAINDIVSATSRMCDQLGVDYAGHIEYGQFPVQVGNSPVYANISRHPSDHHHSARSVIVSVGGGITPSEVADFERQRYGDAFIVSADFAAEAVSRGWMSAETAISLVAIQLDLADGLADREIGASSMLPYDAGRLPINTRSYNEWVFDQAVASLN